MIVSPAEIIRQLRQCIGTEHYYRTVFPNIVFTDGIKKMAELCGAYWLIHVAVSYQYGKIAEEDFQIWRLEKLENSTWRVTMHSIDSEENLVAQNISYSDFPLDEFEFYLIDGVMLLKSEN